MGWLSLVSKVAVASLDFVVLTLHHKDKAAEALSAKQSGEGGGQAAYRHTPTHNKSTQPHPAE